MVKINEIIARVDAVKPNAFSDEVKLGWIAELDGLLAANVFLMSPAEILQVHYSYPEDMETMVLADFPYDNLYDYWLIAKIDFMNGEYERYENTMQLYNAAYSSFVRWFINTYDPAQGHGAEEVRYGTV